VYTAFDDARLTAWRAAAGQGHPNDPRHCDLAHLLSYRFDIQPARRHVARWIAAQRGDVVE
jgi:hypothetical protein